MKLTPNDLRFVVSRIPKDVRKLMIAHGITLGGGFIRETVAGNKPQDIDLFGKPGQDLKAVAALLALSRHGRMHETDNALSVLAPPRMMVQFITRWRYNEPQDIIPDFDFTVCQAAIWAVPGPKWNSEISDAFYPDLAARRLVYTSPQREEAAGGSLLRVRKFLKRGYDIQAPSLAAVIARLVTKVRGEPDEQRATQILLGLLHEVDPAVVIDGLDVIDEHEVVPT